MERECPHCGNEGVRPIYTKNECGERWTIYECPACGAEFEGVDPNG